MKKKKSRLNLAQDEAQAAINETNQKIEELPIMSMMKKMQKEFLMLLAYPYNSMIYG